MTFTVSLSSDAYVVGLRIHSPKFSPATVTKEFAKNCRRVTIDPPITRSPIARSTKRERERLHARVKELDLECSIFHWPFLPDELIEAVLLHCSGTVAVGIDAMIVTWRGTVEFHGEADRLVILSDSQHQVKIAGVKAENDLSGGCLNDCAFLANLPSPAETPLIEGESGLWRIGSLGI